MKKIIILVAVCVILAIKVSATNLRGQVVRYDPYNRNYFPLGNLRVDLWVWNGSQWVDASYAVTGADGFYFFYNVAPGTIFKIQVFGNFFPPQPLTVQYVNPPYFQDIAWIVN